MMLAPSLPPFAENDRAQAGFTAALGAFEPRALPLRGARHRQMPAHIRCAPDILQHTFAQQYRVG